MSGPVDVLAAMDAVESWAREVSDQHIDGEDGLRQAYVQDLRDFRTARAAVAELIDAAKMANGDHSAPHDCYATGPLTGNPYTDLIVCPGCRLSAALANVGSAS